MSFELRAPSSKNYPPVGQTRQAAPEQWCETQGSGFGGIRPEEVGIVLPCGVAVLGREVGWAEGAASETRSVGRKAPLDVRHGDAARFEGLRCLPLPFEPSRRLGFVPSQGPITGHFRPSSRSRSPVSGAGQCQTRHWAQPSDGSPQRKGTQFHHAAAHLPALLLHETLFQEP